MNVLREFSALELAAMAGLLIVRVSQPDVVLYDHPFLRVGPGANDDLIATIACRRGLQRRHGAPPSEQRVRHVVERNGFQYIALTASSLMSAG